MYTAREIYRFARMAGFSPDQSATMTAIALAESGGNSGAHNPHGEDSRGLWQINAAAHPELRNVNLYDPVENAKAAFQVSGEGRDVSAWTTTHGGSSAKYLAYRSDALAAARSAGDSGDLGVWTGTRGYGSLLAAGGGGSSAPFDAAFPGPGADGAATPGGTSAAGEEFVRDALAQAGDRYVFGAEADPNDPNPTVFDCSELTQWAAHRAGVDLPDGSWLQYQELAKEGGAMSVEQALKTRGALLFRFSESPTGAGRPAQAHVAISLGDGRTIEARSTKDGVGIFTADTKRFNYAAVIPQFAGGGGAAPAVPDIPLPTTPSPTGQSPLDYGPAVDTDGDGLIDGRELALGTDPTRADTDADGMSDGYELGLHTNPLKADTDGDGVSDSVELATGSNPTSPDSDHDGRLDGSFSTVDTDHDGLTDELEKVLGTDPYSLDSDRDGFTDGLEYHGSFDPTDPLSTPLSSSLPNSLPNPLSDPLGPLGTGVPSASVAGSPLYGSGLPGLGLGGLGTAADPAGGLDDLGVQ